MSNQNQGPSSSLNPSETFTNIKDAANVAKTQVLIVYDCMKKKPYGTIIVILLIILVVVLFSKIVDGFDSVSPPAVVRVNNTETKYGNVSIPSRVYDRKTGIVSDAAQFVTLPEEIIPAWGLEQDDSLNNYGLVDKLDDGNNGLMGLNYNMCSKSCCSKQYPTPFTQDVDVVADSMSDKFTPSQYTCNNAWQNTGCVCMTKNQKSFLASRGNNNN